MSNFITSTKDLATLVDKLVAIDPVMATLYQQNGLPELRYREPGFSAVLSAIVSQQVSTASAVAIMNRLEAADLTTETAISNASEAKLIEAGLSRQKRRYVTALAEAQIDWPHLATQPTEEVVATLTNVVGVGQWTAEIYCMFSLGHVDAFAAGDLALQIASADAYKYVLAPSPIKRERQVREFSHRWQPYRAIAARLLWDDYTRKQRSPQSTT